jgi:hypothetical protein
MPKWVYFTGVPALIILAALIGVGLMTITGAIPSTEVQAGENVLQSDKDALITNGVISEGDTLKYLYSVGFTSVLEGGSALTSDRVIFYMSDENKELQVYVIYFNDISFIELIEMGDFMDAWIQVALSRESRGDIKFIESLRSMISGEPYNKQRQQHPAGWTR